MREDSVYIHHIVECIRRIEENTSTDREEFLQTHTLQDAVLRNLQTLSEATQRLSDAAKAGYPRSNGPGLRPSEMCSCTIILGLIWRLFGRLFSATYPNSSESY